MVLSFSHNAVLEKDRFRQEAGAIAMPKEQKSVSPSVARDQEKPVVPEHYEGTSFEGFLEWTVADKKRRDLATTKRLVDMLRADLVP